MAYSDCEAWVKSGTDITPRTADDDVLLHDGSAVNFGNGNPGTADTTVSRAAAGVLQTENLRVAGDGSVSGSVVVNGGTVAATPATGDVTLYAKGKKLYQVDEDGLETDLTTGAAGPWTRTGTLVELTNAGDTVRMATGDDIQTQDEISVFASADDPDSDQAVMRITQTGIFFGPGGALGLDNQLSRVAADLMQFSKNLRLDGDAGVSGGLIINSGTAQPTPAAGDVTLYANSKKLYQIDEDGVSIDLTAGTSRAPDSAQYLTLATDAGLSNERVFTAGVGIQVTDAGAGGAYTVASATTAGDGISVVNGGAGTAETISSTSPWHMIKKTADQSKTSDTTVANDDTLYFTAAAASKYLIKGTVYYFSTALGDFKWSLLAAQAPAAAYGKDDYIIAQALTTQTTTSRLALPGNIALDQTGNGGGGVIHFEYYVQTHATNSGTLGFAWAQNTSNLSATKVLAGSHLEWQKIA